MTKTIDEMIEVMQAYKDGKAIEYGDGGKWSLIGGPSWNWGTYNYRIAVTKPSIDWGHVAPEYKWMAVDRDGVAFLYSKKPIVAPSCWNASGAMSQACGFSSFTPGTCSWEDSLVERPS